MSRPQRPDDIIDFLLGCCVVVAVIVVIVGVVALLRGAT